MTLALYSSSATSLFTEGKGLIQSIFNQEDVTATIYICTALQTLTWDPFATVLLPHLVPFARRHWISHSKDIIQLLDLLFQNSSSLISTISSVYVATPGLIRLHALDTSSQQAALLDDLLVSTLKQDFDWSHELSLTINQESTNLATVASICMALMSVDVSRLDDFLPTLQAMFNSLLDAYLSQMALEPVSGTLVRGEPKHILGCLLGKVLETLVVVSGRIIKKTTASLIDILDPIMSDLLPACDDNARLLEGIAAFLEELSGQELLTDQWRAAYEPLKYLLHSQDTALRTSCLRILTACEKTEKDSVRAPKTLETIANFL